MSQNILLYAIYKRIFSCSLLSQSVPVYPEAQEQLYSLTPSVQLPPFSQGLGMQSLISKQRQQRFSYKVHCRDCCILTLIRNFGIQNFKYVVIHRFAFYNTVCSSLPVSQFVPVYPGIQVQLYSLTPSVQFPSFSQGLGMQSLTSKTETIKAFYIIFTVQTIKL